MSFCHIRVDTLITFDATKRNFFKCIDLCDVFWSLYQQQYSKDQFMQLHAYKESLPTPVSLPELQKSSSIDSSTFSSNSYASNSLSSPVTSLDESNKGLCSNPTAYTSCGSVPDGVDTSNYTNDSSFETVANVAYSSIPYAPLYNQVA